MKTSNGRRRNVRQGCGSACGNGEGVGRIAQIGVSDFVTIADYRPIQEARGVRPKLIVTFARGIPATLRAALLRTPDISCHMCGAASGDTDDVTGCAVRFRVSYLVAKSLGGQDELSKLRTLCTTCDRGFKQIQVVRPTAIWLLSQVRRGGEAEQRAVLAVLLRKFGVPAG